MPRSRTVFPLWLEWSGLPTHLNERIRIGAWSVFRRVVELDCECNRVPNAVEITLAELAEWCGLSTSTCRRLLEGLRKQRALLVFLPESEEEPMLLQVRVPLATPRGIEEVAEAHPELHLLEPGANDRYARTDEEVDPEDPRVRATVDLYLNLISLRMNSFILDELIFIAQRFSRREIERVFRQVARRDNPSLAGAARELSRRHGKKDKDRADRRR